MWWALFFFTCGWPPPHVKKASRYAFYLRESSTFRIMVGKQKGVKSFNWEHRGRRKSRSREKKQEKYKIHPEWAPEIKPKHRNSLPNRRQQGGAFGAAPLGFVAGGPEAPMDNHGDPAPLLVTERRKLTGICEERTTGCPRTEPEPPEPNRHEPNRHEPTRTANRREPNWHEPPNRPNRTDTNRPGFQFLGKRRRHENVRTKILCVRSRGPQLSWGLFS